MDLFTLTPEALCKTKLRLLKMHFDAGVGHIGGNLSSLDIMMSIYHHALQSDDAFILSKGHSAGALYATLWSKGLISDDELTTFHRDDTLLSAHPPAGGIRSIPFATGSLGHGPGLASGLALAKRFQGNSGRVFCLTSDGEWNEGSCWESLIFAKHHKLTNLTLIIDLNGLQGFGTTSEVADMGSLAEKFRAFVPSVQEVDGHDVIALQKAFATRGSADGPSVIVAKTLKGSGISFMEGRMEWHYLPLNQALYDQAVQEVEATALQCRTHAV